MAVNEKRDLIPETFDSIAAAADFWDTHSLADYEDQLHDVDIDVRARRRVTLDSDVCKL